MKTIFILLLAAFNFYTVNAQKYISKNGHVSFYSSTPIENIEANNNQAASILDSSNGELVFNLLIKSFEFKNALMQEHFNENYMESNKFPKASFKGKVTNISSVNFSKDGTYDVDVTGDLTIHGVTKPVTAKGNISVKGGTVSAESKFVVQPSDYNIQIPKLVEGKIARQIEVRVDLTYSKM
jgi:polyisoprenoid-binding protein YceI